MKLGKVYSANELVWPGAEPVPGYRLLHRLGRGGIAEVWKAEGPGGFLVALKFVRLGQGRGGTAELRALEITKGIRHPNLVVSFGAWLVEETLILGMELADRTLWDRYVEAEDAGQVGIPRDELMDYLVEAARGIDHLNDRRHRFGDRDPRAIQHRDIKPQNLLLFGGGVKVSDFGMARLLDQTVVGNSASWTFAYAAPEFFKRRAARQSDQYSLAVTYCHLRGGRLPFSGGAEVVMAGHLLNAPDLTMLPAPERPAVARALSKDPKDRWPTCRAFVEALRSSGSAVGAGLIDEGFESPESERRLEFGRRPSEKEAGSSDYELVPDDAASPVDSEDPTLTYDLLAPESGRRSRPVGAIRALSVVALLGVVVALGARSLIDDRPDRGVAVVPGPPPESRAALIVGAPGGPPGPTVPAQAGRPEEPDEPPPVPARRADGREALPIRSQGDPDRGKAPGLAATAPTGPVASPMGGSMGDLPGPVAADGFADPKGELASADGREAPGSKVAADREDAPGQAAAEVGREPEDAPAQAPEPVALRLEVPGSLELRAGESASLPIRVRREGVAGPVAVRFEEVPGGVSLDGLTIAADADGAEATAAVLPEAGPAEAKLRVIGSAGPVETSGWIRVAVRAASVQDLIRRGNASFEKGQYAAAIAAFGEAIRLDPANALAYSSRASAHHREGDLDRAIVDYSEALRLRPDDPVTSNNRGLAYRERGLYYKAIADYSEALRLRPDDPVVHYNRGQAYSHLGDSVGAIADFSAAIRLRPRFADAYRRRGDVHAKRGDLARAKADHDEALRLDSGPERAGDDPVGRE